MIVKAGIDLAAAVIGLFGERGKDTQERIQQRIGAMERTWTDEFIVVIFFAPLVVSWFSPERSNAWVANLEAMPEWYVYLLMAIVSAVFGLGKLKGPKTSPVNLR
tara:strand:- start:931 stop:1245 length:315 start_codon:yes stop_codon:yes gene_type:complete